MFSLILMWMLVGCGVLGLVTVLYFAWRGVPQRAIDDVVYFLYPVDSALLAALLDPATDHDLRWNLGPRNFRDAQRRRMRVFGELLRRMAHNSRVLVEFGNALSLDDSFEPGFGSKLHEAAANVCVYCTGARLRLRGWLSLPNGFGLVPTPGLADLRKAADVDGVKAYDELRTAAAEAFARLRPDELDALTRGL